VWVIAETSDLTDRYAKVVVTDDNGRYLIPELPQARYDVWVRGYGLIDGPKKKTTPGKKVNLLAVPRRARRKAAEYYPGMYLVFAADDPRQERVPGHRRERQRNSRDDEGASTTGSTP
jgi:hypothetical protein